MNTTETRTRIQLTLSHCIKHWSIYRPNVAALVTDDEVISYLRLQRYIDSCRVSIQELHLPRQSTIGILVANKWRFVAAVVAGLSEACTPVLLNLAAPQNVIRSMIADAGCAALITDCHEGIVAPTTFGLPTLDFPENVGRVGCPANISEMLPRYVDDIWGIIYSSGTTGIPKGIVRSDFSMLNEMLGWCLELPIARDSVAMIGRPVYYTGGFVLTASTLFVGGTVVLPNEWSLESYRNFNDQYPIDFLFLLPNQVFDLVSHKRVTSESWPHPRRILTMGAPISPDLKRSVCEVIGCQYIESWGNSEGLGTITDANDVTTRPRSIGRPFLTDDLFIIDELGQNAPAGCVGRLAGRADSTLIEYRNRDDLNRSLLQNGTVISEDLGFVDSDGYFYVCGRVTQRIMRNGIPVFATDIEDIIKESSLVQEVAVFGIPDSHEGEVPIAALVLKARTEMRSGEMIETVNAALSPEQRISGILIYDALPRNAAGKIDYPPIRGRYLDRVNGGASDREAV